MSQPEKVCPLDWVEKDGKLMLNEEEFRGTLILRTPHIFSYGERYPNSRYLPSDCYMTIVITNVDHDRSIDYLQFAFRGEYEAHFRKAMELMKGRSWNLSFNSDENAGAHLPDHAHIKFEDRLPNEAASGRGTRGLINDLNRITEELSSLKQAYNGYLPYQ